MAVHVTGVGMTDFGKFPDRSPKSLVSEAVGDALKDAGLTTADVDAVYFGSAAAGLLTGQEMVRGEVLLRDSGIAGVPIFNVENACATASSALHLGWQALLAGTADTVLCVGVEKMSHDKALAFDALASALDVEAGDDVTAALGITPDPSRSVFMDVYATRIRAHMERYGTTEQMLGAVTAKNSRHGALNPKAQYRTVRTARDVLESRLIVSPLRLLMCAPIGDGAAAAVLQRGTGADPGVRVAASVIRTGDLPESGSLPAATRAAGAAWTMAGLGPEDVDLVEVHDATSPAEILSLEELELFGPGEAGPATEDGVTSLGGRLPVNPSGGLCSRGHPIGATGLAQVCEAVWHLRGEAGDRQVADARVAMTHNSGGWVGTDYAVQAVHLFTV